MSYAAIALLGLLLLMALVAFGLGQSRWSWASVAASFLIVLTLGGYLYLASRLLAFEWQWVKSVRTAKARLFDLEEGKGAGPEGLPSDMSLATLAEVRNRWQRALSTIDTWRGRRWEQASFEPPTTDGKPGRLEIPGPRREQPPEDGAADPADSAVARSGEPLDPGMTLYLFDDTPFSDGGRYLGSFLVDAIEVNADGSQIVTVLPTARPDAYDTRAWEAGYDSVSVFDRLPTDRWTAYTKTPVPSADGGNPPPGAMDDPISPRPTMRNDDIIDQLAAEPFRSSVQRHATSEAIDESEWDSIRAGLDEGKVLPGEYWAEVDFANEVDRNAFLGIDGGDSLTVEVELGSAFALREEGKATIRRVFYRRPLRDAETWVHGSVVPAEDEAGTGILADGLAGLMRSMRRDIAALEESNRQLDIAQEKAEAEKGLLSTQAGELRADLKNWERDVAAADKTAAAFAAAVEAASSRLESAERRVVELGRELDAEVGRAVREIDLVAPPPAGRAAGRSAAAF